MAMSPYYIRYIEDYQDFSVLLFDYCNGNFLKGWVEMFQRDYEMGRLLQC